ncbi:hypothetical protein J7L68_05025 [bacterium]|nr:hypothetical protein [bacterium]
MNEILPSKIKTSKIIFQVLGWLYLIFGILGGIIVFVLGIFPKSSSSGSEHTIATIIIGIIIIIFSVIYGILYFVVAKGIANRKNWANIVGIILAILMLFSIPIGTVLGIIILIDLFSDEGKQWFAESENAPVA